MSRAHQSRIEWDLVIEEPSKSACTISTRLKLDLDRDKKALLGIIEQKSNNTAWTTYIELTPDQADQLADKLKKWTAAARRHNG